MSVQVSYPPYTCNALAVRVPAGGRVVLDYNTHLLAYLGLAASLPAIILAVCGLGWVLDRAPNGFGVVGAVGLLVLTAAVAQAIVGGPLRALGWCGLRTHRLRLARVDLGVGADHAEPVAAPDPAAGFATIGRFLKT